MSESSQTCRFEQILANLPAHVFVIDLERRTVVYSNHTLRWALGYPMTVGDDEVLEDMLHPEDRPLLDEVATGFQNIPDGATVDLEFRMKAVDGSWHWFGTRTRVFTRDANGRPSQIVAASADVTASKLVVDRIQHEARHDHLTGLLNRQQFLAALERLIASGPTPSTMCICDIDYFKGVNDSYGHLAGDRVLQAFAAILKRTLRHNDVIARLGGDEFGILFPGGTVEFCAPPMDRVREQLAGTRFPVGGDAFSVTASFGLAAFDGIGDGQVWMEAADRALYEAKRKGRNQMSRGSLDPDAR